MSARNLSYDQFTDAGPSPTHEDAMKTIVHLTDSASFNAKHGASHLASAREEAAKLADGAKVVWHLDHATKHTISTHEDLESLRNHIKESPFLRQAVDEMTNLTRRHQGW